MNNKIICFINNDGYDVVENGICRCFSQKDNFSSNEFCKEHLFELNQRGDEIVRLILGQNGNNFLFISYIGAEFVSVLSDAPEGWKILLVHDSVSVAQILDDISTPDTLILYHRKPVDAEIIFDGIDKKKNEGKYKRAIKSIHEPSGKYALLFEIARIWNPATKSFDKNEFEIVFKKIKNELYNAKLETTLEFLHGCLEKNPEQSVYYKLKIVGIEEDNLKNKITVGRNHANYNKQLSDLRDELLELAK